MSQFTADILTPEDAEYAYAPPPVVAVDPDPASHPEQLEWRPAGAEGGAS